MGVRKWLGRELEVETHKAVNHALGISLGWFKKTSSYVDVVCNQGIMIIVGIRLNTTKYFSFLMISES